MVHGKVGDEIKQVKRLIFLPTREVDNADADDETQKALRSHGKLSSRWQQWGKVSDDIVHPMFWYYHPLWHNTLDNEEWTTRDGKHFELSKSQSSLINND